MNFYNKICRICFKERHNMVLLSEDLHGVSSNVTNLEAMEYVMSTKILHSSVTPKMICSTCQCSLEVAYEIKLRFNETTKKLEELHGFSGVIEELKSEAQLKNQKRTAPVEVSIGSIYYDIRDLFRLEDENEENQNINYEGFLRNLGSEISAKFVKKHDYTKQTDGRITDLGTVSDSSQTQEKFTTEPSSQLEEKFITEPSSELQTNIPIKTLDIDQYIKFIPEEERKLVKQAMNYKYQCKKCYQYFSVKGKYLNHIKKNACRSPRKKCIKIMTVYKCNKCDETYEDQSTYLEHVNNCFLNSESNCLDPKSNNSNIDQILKPVSDNYGIRTNFEDLVEATLSDDHDNYGKNEENGTDNTTQNEILYECAECSKTFINNSLYLKHNCKSLDTFESEPAFQPKIIINNKTSILNIEQSVSCKSKDQQDLLKEAMNYKYQCKKCQKCFNVRGNYFNHIKKRVCGTENRTKKGEKPKEIQRKTIYNCNQCEYKTKIKDMYSHHLDTKHKLESIKCKKCDYSSKSKKNFDYHSLKHKEHKYSCKECGKKFRTTTHLKSHSQKHSKLPLYLCNLCGKGFFYKNAHVYHMRRHNNEKNYACQFCGKLFEMISSLKVHERVHTGSKPYKCKQCDRAYNVRTALIEHERSHTGERPFKCNYCEMEFKTGKNLIQHLRSHSGPHECDWCSKTFLDSNYLIDHLKKRHGVNCEAISNV